MADDMLQLRSAISILRAEMQAQQSRLLSQAEQIRRLTNTQSRGTPGPAGPQGDVGPAGPQGDPGPAGADADPSALAALTSEVEDARGDRSALGLRISTISNFASPNAGGVVSGSYYDNAFHGTNAITLAQAANRFDLVPFYTSVPLTIDQIGVGVSTAGAGTLGRCAIYGSDASGWPDALLFYGAADLDFGTTGYKFHDLTAMPFTFDSGRQYWLGIHVSGTATIRAVNVSSSVNLGLSGNNSTSYFTVIRRNQTYASGAPNPWGFVASQRTAAIHPPSIRMRSA